MLNKLLLLTSFLLVSYTLQAQITTDSLEPKPEPERHKWEVALDVWQVIRDPKEGLTGFMVRKHFTSVDDRKMAYRFGLYTSHSFISQPDWTKRRPHFNQLALKFGKEWQKQTGKFMVYYGSEIAFYGRFDRDLAAGSGFTFPEGEEYAYSRGSNLFLGGSLVGFIGAKYLFSDRFSLSVETNAYYQLSKEKTITKYYNMNNEAIKTSTGNYYAYHILDFQPISTFYISYYF